MATLNEQVEQAQAEAAKAANDAVVAVNAKVQEVGPSVVSFWRKYWYVWVGVVAALCLAGFAANGLAL